MKPNAIILGAAASLFWAALAGAAQASSVIYSSVPSLDNLPTYWCSDCYGGGTYEPLDPFTLSGGASVGGVHLVTYNQDGYNGLDPFTVEVYDSTHSTIIFSEAVTSTLVTSGVDGNGFNYDVVDAAVSGLTLPAGSYWIGFIAPQFAVAGGGGGNGGLIETSPPHSGVFDFALGGNTEYQLLSAVPEPGTWALMLVGFGGLGVLALRGRSKVLVAA